MTARTFSKKFCYPKSVWNQIEINIKYSIEHDGIQVIMFKLKEHVPNT